MPAGPAGPTAPCGAGCSRCNAYAPANPHTAQNKPTASNLVSRTPRPRGFVIIGEGCTPRCLVGGETKGLIPPAWRRVLHQLSHRSRANDPATDVKRQTNKRGWGRVLKPWAQEGCCTRGYPSDGWVPAHPAGPSSLARAERAWRIFPADCALRRIGTRMHGSAMACALRDGPIARGHRVRWAAVRSVSRLCCAARGTYTCRSGPPAGWAALPGLSQRRAVSTHHSLRWNPVSGSSDGWYATGRRR